jgi:hypothetical protein
MKQDKDIAVALTGLPVPSGSNHPDAVIMFEEGACVTLE